MNLHLYGLTLTITYEFVGNQWNMQLALNTILFGCKGGCIVY